MAWPVQRANGFLLDATAWNEVVAALSAWGGSVNAGGNTLSNLGVVTQTAAASIAAGVNVTVNGAQPYFGLKTAGVLRTAWYHDGADYLHLGRYDDLGVFVANAVTVARSTGNVGISQTLPDSPLHITRSHAVGTVTLVKTSFDGNWGFHLDSVYPETGGIDYAFRQRYSSSEYNVLYFKGGKVSVGGTNPTSLLELWGTSPGLAIINNPGVAGNPYLTLTPAGAANSATINIGNAVLRQDTDKPGQLLINPAGTASYNVSIGADYAYGRLTVITPAYAAPSLNLRTAAHTVFAVSAGTELAIFHTGQVNDNYPVALQTRHNFQNSLVYPLCLNPLGGGVFIGTYGAGSVGNLIIDAATRPLFLRNPGTGNGWAIRNDSAVFSIGYENDAGTALATSALKTTWDGYIVFTIKTAAVGADYQSLNGTGQIYADETNKKIWLQYRTSGGVLKQVELGVYT